MFKNIISLYVLEVTLLLTELRGLLIISSAFKLVRIVRRNSDLNSLFPKKKLSKISNRVSLEDTICGIHAAFRVLNLLSISMIDKQISVISPIKVLRLILSDLFHLKLYNSLWTANIYSLYRCNQINKICFKRNITAKFYQCKQNMTRHLFL